MKENMENVKKKNVDITIWGITQNLQQVSRSRKKIRIAKKNDKIIKEKVGM